MIVSALVGSCLSFSIATSVRVLRAVNGHSERALVPEQRMSSVGPFSLVPPLIQQDSHRSRLFIPTATHTMVTLVMFVIEVESSRSSVSWAVVAVATLALGH